MPNIMTDADDMRRYSHAVRLKTEKDIEELTQRLADGDISLATWEREMLYIVKNANVQQYIVGKGGDEDAIKRADLIRARTKSSKEMLRQRQYLRDFSKIIQKADENGKPLDFAISRAKMYAKSTQAFFWKTQVPVDLPQVPRDGQTQCRTNCKCRLRIQYERDNDQNVTAVLVWWLLSPAEHCSDCLKLAREWNPLRMEVNEGEVTEAESSIEQAIALLVMDMDADRPDLAARVIREMFIDEKEAVHV